MTSIFTCDDTSDTKELEPKLGLYLKPIARATITIQLPSCFAKNCISVSTWELQEKLRDVIKPIILVSLKVIKTTLDIIRFEAEVSNKTELRQITERLDTSVKLTGWPEAARVKCAEAKLTFVTRHKWESHFRDAKGLDEMKPGERPDTLYIKGLPIKWFCERGERGGNMKPSLTYLHQTFATIADVRCVDIPILDEQAKSSVVNSFGKMGSMELVFDAYIQYREYVGFVKAMDTLRGMKLAHQVVNPSSKDVKAFTADIVVDFDRTSHLSDENIKQRAQSNAKYKKRLLDIVKKEQLKRRFEEESEQLKRSRNDEQEKKLKREATNLCKGLINIVSKDVENNVEEVKERSKKEMLVLQEQLLRERLLRKLQEKKLQASLESRSRGKL